MRDPIKIIKGILFNQNNFFNQVAKEKNTKDSLFIFMVFYVVFCLITLVVFSLQPTVSGWFYLFLPLAFIINLLFFFIYILVVHKFFKLFKGQGAYKDTFNLIAYSNVPLLSVMFLFFIVLFFGSQLKFLMAFFLILLIPLYLLGLVALAFYIISIIKGGSILHKINYTRSFLAGIALPALIAFGVNIIFFIVIIIISLIGQF